MIDELITFETAKLAKAKGFDEIVRSCFGALAGKVVPVDPPKDSEMIGYLMGVYLKGHFDPDSIMRKLEAMQQLQARELRNSTLPPEVYARPTQSLMARWMREKHSICLFVWRSSKGKYKWTLMYFGDHSPCPFDPAFEWEDGDEFIGPGEFATYEEAMEDGLLKILNAFPDAVPTV